MKKVIRQWKHVVVVMAFALGILFAGQMHVNAATAVPTGLVQTGAGSNYVEVRWNAVMQDSVTIYLRISDNPSFQGYRSDMQSGTYAFIGNLSAGTTYYVQIGTSETNTWGSVPADTAWSSTLEVVTAPENLNDKTYRQEGATVSSVKLAWDAVTGATSYKVVYAKDGESMDSGATVMTNTNSVTLSNLANNTEYQIEVQPMRTSAQGFSAVTQYAGKTWCKVLPSKITDVENIEFYAYSNIADFEWKKSDSRDGYQYYIYDNSNKRIYSGKSYNNSVSVSTSKLKKDQFYRIKVRGYVNLANNKTAYGSWSDTLYFAKTPQESVKAKNSSGGIKVSWKKVTGATNYTVYISTKKNSGYKKVKTVTKPNLTITKYGKAKLKSGKTYYIRIVANKKVGKKTYKSTDSYDYSAYIYKK